MFIFTLIFMASLLILHYPLYLYMYSVSETFSDNFCIIRRAENSNGYNFISSKVNAVKD